MCYIVILDALDGLDTLGILGILDGLGILGNLGNLDRLDDLGDLEGLDILWILGDLGIEGVVWGLSYWQSKAKANNANNYAGILVQSKKKQYLCIRFREPHSQNR